MKRDLVYLNYWKRKELLRRGLPNFPVLRWWQSEELSESEQLIFSKVKDRDTILDIGAGDLTMMWKVKRSGYAGDYHTQDIGEEFEYTYSNLNEINQLYPAILCLDVIEHLLLSEGLALIHSLVNLLKPGGIIIIQTPNARCIRNPLSWDITHLHSYNIQDLWAYLSAMGLSVEGYKVVFESPTKNWVQKQISAIFRYIITRKLGLDYTDNIVLIASKATS